MIWTFNKYEDMDIQQFAWIEKNNNYYQIGSPIRLNDSDDEGIKETKTVTCPICGEENKIEVFRIGSSNIDSISCRFCRYNIHVDW